MQSYLAVADEKRLDRQENQPADKSHAVDVDYRRIGGGITLGMLDDFRDEAGENADPDDTDVGEKETSVPGVAWSKGLALPGSRSWSRDSSCQRPLLVSSPSTQSYSIGPRVASRFCRSPQIASGSHECRSSGPASYRR